jgi:hypothetical protein
MISLTITNPLAIKTLLLSQIEDPDAFNAALLKAIRHLL